MKVAAWVLLLTLTSLLTYAGYAIAEAVASAVTQTDLLQYIFTPETGTIAVLLIVSAMLWRALQKSECRREELSKEVVEVLLSQREYAIAVEEKRHQSELQVMAHLERVSLLLDRVEGKIN